MELNGIPEKERGVKISLNVGLFVFNDLCTEKMLEIEGLETQSLQIWKR